MLGNTVNRYCPYFKEMGLAHIKEMKPGDIDLYRYGDSELTVAVEYTTPKKNSPDEYFAGLFFLRSLPVFPVRAPSG